jgi:hypothetical protein
LFVVYVQSQPCTPGCSAGSACASCAAFNCTDKLAGLNGRRCLKFTTDGTAFCSAGGVCESLCQSVVSQNTTVHQECGHIGCVRPGVCALNSSLASVTAGSTSAAKSTLCFTDARQYGCPVGASCNLNGDCVYINTAGTGWNSTQCFGADVCSNRVCCNRACTDECEECLLGDGNCKARTGQPCSFDVACTQFVKGFNASVPTQCDRFAVDRKGVCLPRGVCGNATDLCPGLPGVALQTCGSLGCRRNACDPFTSVASVATIESLCFTDSLQHACPVGAVPAHARSMG